MAVMHIAHIEAGALPPQAARPQSRQRAFVPQLREWIRLLHELGKLRRTEEFAHRRHNRANVNQRHRRQLLGFANGHAFLDHALHAPQADAQLVADQLANGFDAAIAKVINIIFCASAVVDEDHLLNQFDDIRLGDRPVGQVDRVAMPETLIQLVSSHALQVVAALVKELTLKVFLRVVQRRRIARAHPAIELNQRDLSQGLLLLDIPNRFVLEAALDVAVRLAAVDFGKESKDFFILAGLYRRLPRRQAIVNRRQRAQQNGHWNRPLAIELDRDVIRLARLEFHPGAAIRDQLGVG